MANIAVVDGSHLLYNEYYGQIQDQEGLTREQAAAIIAAALLLLQRYKRRFKADHLIVAFDDTDSWRSDYTKRFGLKPYKISRNVFKTPRERRLKRAFDNLREYFITLLRGRPGVFVVRGKGLEADDLISGLARKKKPEDTMDVVTLDKDTAQLGLIAGVSVYFMRGLKKMSTSKLKEKVLARELRGRPAYSVPSVFPRLTTRLWRKLLRGTLKLEDLYKLMPFKKGSKISAAVRHQHNIALLTMTKQPKSIQKRINDSINESLNNQQP